MNIRLHITLYRSYYRHENIVSFYVLQIYISYSIVFNTYIYCIIIIILIIDNYWFPYHVEVPIATEVELTLHHVKKDGNCCFPQLRLWDQGHLQDWPHHWWDEFYLVGTCKEFKVKYIQWQDLDLQCLSTLFTQQTLCLECGFYADTT